ncbi:MAG TPA: cell division ATP-binding protein FtsE [Candidatus Nesterenkonia stercoripullorum]|uniref:Cell division ATP-binding protein FtsE n=1 Tax=Candidatus Nesterenkonia stercoripullorum TaxID=2838701 RepID=A0A9D1UU30_9MICC|nr:cell division ATP-binding protein FtsE [Candidatus Nesterenkonia stercoripullorum]
MIRFENVTRRYDSGGRPALDGVTVEFLREDFVYLIGASGSGKSTLLRMILREGLPQQGKITVAGQNLGLMLERRVPAFRRSIGMVFQDFRLLPEKTVFENVAFAMRVIGARRSQVRQRVNAVLERVDLAHLAKRYPHEISGGEQQRAAIARAIVNEPAILLADEPTGNLDPRASADVMKILRWINANGTTVVMATHDRSIVDAMRRRVVQLHDGSLIRDERGGSYDAPVGSEAWTILQEDEESQRDSAGGSLAPGAVGVLSLNEPSPSSEDADLAGASASESGAGSLDPARADAAEPDAEGDDVEAHLESDPSDEHTRVVWPSQGDEDEPQATAEPLGGFNGAELPDLDQDGYIDEDELGAEADAEPIDGDDEAEDDVDAEAIVVDDEPLDEGLFVELPDAQHEETDYAEDESAQVLLAEGDPAEAEPAAGEAAEAELAEGEPVEPVPAEVGHAAGPTVEEEPAEPERAEGRPEEESNGGDAVVVPAAALPGHNVPAADDVVPDVGAGADDWTDDSEVPANPFSDDDFADDLVTENPFAEQAPESPASEPAGQVAQEHSAQGAAAAADGQAPASDAADDPDPHDASPARRSFFRRRRNN